MARYEERNPQDLVNHRNGLNDLASRPYWARLWIIQEYTHSQDVTIWCGTGAMKTSALNWAYDHITDWRSIPSNVGYYITPRRFKEDTQSMQGSTLSDLITFTQCSLCADGRDRFYGILSLLTPKERELWSIEPDYANPPQELFERLDSVYRDKEVDVYRYIWADAEWENMLRRMLGLPNVHDLIRSGLWEDPATRELCQANGRGEMSWMDSREMDTKLNEALEQLKYRRDGEDQ
jgi:hypothetical protein